MFGSNYCRLIHNRWNLGWSQVQPPAKHQNGSPSPLASLKMTTAKVRGQPCFLIEGQADLCWGSIYLLLLYVRRSQASCRSVAAIPKMHNGHLLCMHALLQQHPAAVTLSESYPWSSWSLNACFKSAYATNNHCPRTAAGSLRLLAVFQIAFFCSVHVNMGSVPNHVPLICTYQKWWHFFLPVAISSTTSTTASSKQAGETE